MLRKLYYLLSPKLRLIIRRIVYLPYDILNRKNYKKNLHPPVGMIFTGSGDFINQGKTFLNYFIELGNLKPDHTVLDIGSGIGRMAIPLTGYLSENGRYEGFDIVKNGIKWCQENITKRYPNFTFKHIGLKNSLYNLSTNVNASQMKFPYESGLFDFVFLTSVFTHMLPKDVENYLYEINRVLKKSGTCLATFFILETESRQLQQQNTKFRFSFDKGNYSLMDRKVPEANVAFDYNYLAEIIQKSGLKIKSKHLGYWCGRNKTDALSFQDILILEKPL